MLLKMGWAGAGTGLGVSGQGIDKPIDGGQVRDRQDIYKVSVQEMEVDVGCDYKEDCGLFRASA